MSVVFNLKYFLGLGIFVFGDNKECKNDALNVVDVSILSYFEKLSQIIQIWDDSWTNLQYYLVLDIL